MPNQGTRGDKLTTTISLTRELHARLHDEAARQYRSASSLAAQILSEALKRMRPEAERRDGTGEAA